MKLDCGESKCHIEHNWCCLPKIRSIIENQMKQNWANEERNFMGFSMPTRVYIDNFAIVRNDKLRIYYCNYAISRLRVTANKLMAN